MPPHVLAPRNAEQHADDEQREGELEKLSSCWSVISVFLSDEPELVLNSRADDSGDHGFRQHSSADGTL